MTALELGLVDPPLEDDAVYLELCRVLERRLHPAVAAVLARDELAGNGSPYTRPARPRRLAA